MSINSTTKLVIFDSDGVLVQEGVAIDGAAEITSYLKSKGIISYVLSNNSTKHPQTMLHTYHQQGIMVDEVVNSGVLTALYCLKMNYSTVFVVGEEGLHQILKEQGITIGETDVDAVIVGMDRSVTYEKLAIATRLIRSGAAFVATNPDPSFPTPRGLEPGAGSMIAALEAATDQSVSMIVGKPHTFGFDHILELCDIKPSQALMIGDRYETDIIGAIDCDVPALVVRTGIAATRQNPGTYQDYPQVPVIDSLHDLVP